jgi:putative CocE/NonD family hydrolase
MIPQAAGGANVDRGFGIYVGGVLTLSSAFRWFYDYGSIPNPRPQTPEKDLFEVMRSLPLIRMMEEAEGPPTDWETVVSHPPGNAYWYDRGYVRETDRFDTPALHVNSWYDYGVHQSLYQFNLMRRNGITNLGRDHQYILISPTTHCASEYSCSENTIVGERELGDARFDFLGLYLRWYEYWLKRIDNGVTQTPKVQYYVMGRNAWAQASEWPLPETRFVKYYLHSDGRANTLHGGGILSTDLPDVEPPDRFVYDPENPVPTVGGPSFDTVSAGGTPGAYDQSEIEQREDVLVYSTPVLNKGIEVTGPIELVLYISSSVKDTDFTGKLVDVYPDGKAYNVQEGIIRTRYRDGWIDPDLMEPGTVYEIRFPLESTSNYFGPGHRIRLEVSGSNFPGYARNLNTGGNNYDESEWIVAKNTVYHTAQYPSHLVLPVIPEKE